MHTATWQFVLYLAVALLLGATVGMERQWRQRMAGMRTNALVSAGASAFVMAGTLIEGDPSAAGRIASYVVSGVGFLGAGVTSRMEPTFAGSIRLQQSGVQRPSASCAGSVICYLRCCWLSLCCLPTSAYGGLHTGCIPCFPRLSPPRPII